MKKFLLTIGTLGVTVLPVATVIACGSSSSTKMPDLPFSYANAELKDVTDSKVMAKVVYDQLQALHDAVHNASDYWTFFRPEPFLVFNDSAYNFIVSNRFDPAAMATTSNAIKQALSGINGTLSSLTLTLDVPPQNVFLHNSLLTKGQPAANELPTTFSANPITFDLFDLGNGKSAFAFVSHIVATSGADVVKITPKMVSDSSTTKNFLGVNVAVKWDKTQRDALANALDNAMKKIEPLTK